MNNLNTKLKYVLDKVKTIKNPQVLELGVHKGKSTNLFLDICDKNNGHLISVDIEDCSNVSNNPSWEFIHTSDDNFELINSRIKKHLDVIYIDSLHQDSHVKKVLFNYYNFLKVDGLCFIDDISWLPYISGKKKDNSYMEEINFRIFNKVLSIYNSNMENFFLEFFFEGSGYALITKKNEENLKEEVKLPINKITFRHILKKLFVRKPKR